MCCIGTAMIVSSLKVIDDVVKAEVQCFTSSPKSSKIMRLPDFEIKLNYFVYQVCLFILSIIVVRK